MLYHYIDETYRNEGQYWHCIIGGLIIPINKLVEVEIQLTESINICNSELESFPINSEFKYTDFFRNNSDDFKLAVLAKFVDVIKINSLNVLASHACVRKSNGSEVASKFGGFDKMIQKLAFFNMDEYLSPITANEPVQTVVDMGLNESFKPIYDLYVSAHRTLPYMGSIGFSESSITFKNYQNVPIPLFIESVDSKSIQLSDVIIGLLLTEKLGSLSIFKQKMISLLEPIRNQIICHSVEWNKK